MPETPAETIRRAVVKIREFGDLLRPQSGGHGVFYHDAAELLEHIADDLDDANVTETVDAFGQRELLIGDLPGYRPAWLAALKLARTHLGES